MCSYDIFVSSMSFVDAACLKIVDQNVEVGVNHSDTFRIIIPIRIQRKCAESESEKCLKFYVMIV